jgi:protein-S-isoprenylcysteine O-methyltransferase Ste14
MYLGEMVTAAGIVLFAPAPAQLLLLALFLAAQLVRIHLEELALGQTYPSYREHQRHTWRLLPFLY